MQFDTIAHVGAGKCGSSALQSFLTAHSTLTGRSGRKFHYGAITKGGFVPPEEMAGMLNRSINGYISSVGAGVIDQIPPAAQERIVRTLRKFPSPLILSSEGWLLGMMRPGVNRTLIELLSARGARRVKMIAYVRPPVKWLNSAWWQWGAWKSGVSFPQWIQGALRSCMWNEPARAIAGTPEIAEFELRPVLGDVVAQFLESLGCDPPADGAVSNRSLPKEVLELYRHAPDLRPSPHVVNADFIALRAISQSEHRYSSTPWVLGPAQISMILERTRESNLAMLELMSPEDKKAVLDDPAWWDAGAYANCVRTNPMELPPATPEELLPLSADLMRLLRRAMRVVSAHGLLHELDEPLPPNWLPPDPAGRPARKPRP